MSTTRSLLGQNVFLTHKYNKIYSCHIIDSAIILSRKNIYTTGLMIVWVTQVNNSQLTMTLTTNRVVR